MEQVKTFIKAFTKKSEKFQASIVLLVLGVILILMGSEQEASSALVGSIVLSSMALDEDKEKELNNNKEGEK